MTIQIQAIYENGMLVPLEAVPLTENQRVTVTIEDQGLAAAQIRFVLSPDRWQAFCDALDAPPRDIPALRKLLTNPSILDGEADATPDAGSSR